MNYCGETEEAASLASWERAGGEGGAERRVGSEEIEDDGDCGEARARCGCGVASAGL